MMPPNQQNSKAPEGVEPNLKGLIVFLTGTYKLILIFGLFGLLGATAYLLATPNRYEAVTQIQMAQINFLSDGNGNTGLLGLNVEEPALLISRLRSPASFSDEAAKNCGFGERVNASAFLARSISASAVKGVANIIELKVGGASREGAIACANVIFELIKTSQAQILAPYIEEARAKLNDDEKRLLVTRNALVEADKSERMATTNYLLMRDEIQRLSIEIASLRKTIISSDYRRTHLVTPIYASNMPISPNKRLVLTVGTLGGLLFGVLIAIARRSLVIMRSGE